MSEMWREWGRGREAGTERMMEEEWRTEGGRKEEEERRERERERERERRTVKIKVKKREGRKRDTERRRTHESVSGS